MTKISISAHAGGALVDELLAVRGPRGLGIDSGGREIDHVAAVGVHDGHAGMLSIGEPGRARTPAGSRLVTSPGVMLSVHVRGAYEGRRRWV